MLSKKIYYTDPYLTKIQTKVDASKSENQNTWYTFKETIFYPQGGGQESDSGWINDQVVEDVQSSNGEVWHLLKATLTNPVKMRLDWDKRYSNMRQHTGQHILSACLKKVADLDTLSVHLGREITLIEFDTDQVTDKILEESETLANQIIREHLPVRSTWPDRKELNTIPLRRKIKSEDTNIRLVHVGEFDCVGCGGIHVHSTAEVGLIKIIGAEKIRNHIRIKIKIGDSAYRYYRQLHRVLHNVTARFTCSIEDLPDRIDTLLTENRELSRSKKKISEQWLSEYAHNLTDSGYNGCFYLSGLSKENLKFISGVWVKIHQKSCLFISDEDNRTSFFLRIHGNQDKNAQDFVKRNSKFFDLRGGGDKEFAIGDIANNDINDTLIKSLFQEFLNFL
jgi:alanyl-tRNA synthetase